MTRVGLVGAGPWATMFHAPMLAGASRLELTVVWARRPEAAAALGCEVGAIANSLVFDADGTALLVLTSGAHRVDTSRVAGLVGAGRVQRATPELVRDATGSAIGGVAPLGHPAPLRTLVDTALAAHPVVWAAAGHARTVFPTTYDELLALTGGEAADVGAR